MRLNEHMNWDEIRSRLLAERAARLALQRRARRWAWFASLTGQRWAWFRSLRGLTLPTPADPTFDHHKWAQLQRFTISPRKPTQAEEL